MSEFNTSLLITIGEQIQRSNETIATAESVTSGLLQFAFSNIPNASTFFHGGITAYNLPEKVKHLHVDRDHAQAVNCVSQQVADEMALEVCKLFNTNWGIGITGYASAVPESDGKLFAYYSICHDQVIRFTEKITPLETDPTLIQWFYVNTVIERLAKIF